MEMRFAEDRIERMKMFLQCGKAYVDDDIIVINGTDDELAELQTRLENRRLAAKVSFQLNIELMNTEYDECNLHCVGEGK